MAMDVTPVAAGMKRPRRQHRSVADIENHHGGFCGMYDHKQTACPKAKALLDAQASGKAVVHRTKELTGKDRQLAAFVQKLRYTWPEQRNDIYEAREPRARERQVVTGHQLCRMTAKEVVSMKSECGLLDPL